MTRRARTLSRTFLALCAFATFAAAPALSAGVHISLETPALGLAPGTTFTVKLRVFQADEAFNAFDAFFQFDNTRLAYVANSNQPDSLATVACGSKFQIFAVKQAQPADPDTLALNFSLLCSGATMTGPGAVYRVQFRTLGVPGPTMISLVGATAFYNAGVFVSPLELRNLTVQVLCPAISIAPLSLPAGVVGNFYSQPLSASGGTSPYGYAISLGAAPAGISLSTGGVLSGTPTAAGNASFTVTATDAQGCAGTRSYSLGVTCPSIALAPPSLPNGVVGAAYSRVLSASGGAGAYTFTLDSGMLPAGLTLATDGTIAGTPTAPGTASFVVKAVDANNCPGTLGYAITIDCPEIAIAPAALPNGTVGVAYNQALSASGGVSPYTFTLDSGALPAGLTLATDGTLAGTPTAAGMANFVVKATGTNGCSGTLAYAITIVAVTDVDNRPVTAFAMGPLLPNPRSGSAPGRVTFALPARASVSMELLDLTGRRVATREPETLAAGRYALGWKLPSLSSGVYFVHLSTSTGSSAIARWVVAR